jgi:transposase
VVTSYEGYPIKHYVFEGNTKDETTVIEVVKQLKKEYQIEETTFVGDRGMITKLNLATIEKEGFDYIMGVKHRQNELCTMLFADNILDATQYREYKKLKIQEKIIVIKDFLLWKIAVILKDNDMLADCQPFELLRNLITPLTNKDEIKYKNIKNALADFSATTKVKIKISSLIKKYHGRYEDKVRIIICLNEDRKVLAKTRRENKLSKLSDSLSKLFANMDHNQEAVEIEKKLSTIIEGYNRQYRKYFNILREELTQKAEGYILNQKIISDEEAYDGIFILSTSRQDLIAEKIVDSYKNLKEVEMLFDDLKHFVDVRPVRHWLEVRVRAHVFICILSLLLKRIFEINYLKSKSVMHPLEEISKSKLIKYSVKNSEKENRRQTFLKVTNTTPAQMEIFKMVAIKNPMCLENYVW